MGAKNKTRQKEARKKKKRARKEAQKALYASRRDAGKNTKSFRARKHASRKTVGTISHPDGACGNIACMRDSELFREGGSLHWQLVQKNEGRVKLGLAPLS